jgi:hypothetical protein
MKASKKITKRLEARVKGFEKTMAGANTEIDKAGYRKPGSQKRKCK